jgi:hypothetical protein
MPTDICLSLSVVLSGVKVALYCRLKGRGNDFAALSTADVVLL